MSAGRLVISITLVLGACGDDGAGPADAPIVPVDIDNGSCGDQIRFTGEYVDWDSHKSFCGINDAVIEVAGGGAMDNTAPNGRFDLCIPDAASTRLDITQPSGMSQCTTPPAAYTIPTILFAQKSVIQSGGFFSGRSFTAGRQATLGVTLDPAKAHVFVHIDGPERTVSLAAPHGTAQAIRSGVVGSDWVTGAQGTEVFFPNVDVGAGTTMLSTDTAAIGTGSIPLVAGTLTNVSLKTQ